MNNKGFIATSILYTFFLVLISLFTLLITNFIHNKLMLQKLNNEINNRVNYMKKLSFNQLKRGDIVVFTKVNTSYALFNENSKWLYIGTDGNKAKFIGADASSSGYFVYDNKIHGLTLYYVDKVLLNTYKDNSYFDGFKTTIKIPSMTDINSLIEGKQNVERILDGNNSFVYTDTVGTDIKYFNLDKINYPSCVGGVCQACNGSIYTHTDTLTYGTGDNGANIAKNEVTDYCYVKQDIPNQEENTYNRNFRFVLFVEEADTKYVNSGKGTWEIPYIITDGGKPE